MNDFGPLKSLLDPVVWDRIWKSMHHEEGDRVPIWDYLDNRATYEHFAQPGDDLTQGCVRVYHGLGIDLCRGFGSSFDESTEGVVEDHGEYETTISGQSRWVSRRWINSYEELRQHQVTTVKDEDLQGWVEGIAATQEQFAPHTMYVPGYGCGFHASHSLMGVQMFSLAIYDEPDHLWRIMEAINENCVRFAEAAANAKLAPLFFVGDDVAYKDKLMFSPKFLKESLVKYVGRMCAPLNAAGIKVIFHSDGDITDIVDDLVEVGIAGLNPIEPIAGMDIGYLRKRYGKNLILVGNVDCSQVLPLGSREDVINAVKDCLRSAAPGGGHFIGSSSEIVPATPLENVLTFYEACREHGKYPIRC
ncbi:MAG: hypothetical protein HY318_09820 [Armatimonadetes bacterium]|nr:hypothetical protein [Armatimonadota bacterium]